MRLFFFNFTNLWTEKTRGRNVHYEPRLPFVHHGRLANRTEPSRPRMLALGPGGGRLV